MTVWNEKARMSDIELDKRVFCHNKILFFIVTEVIFIQKSFWWSPEFLRQVNESEKVVIHFIIYEQFQIPIQPVPNTSIACWDLEWLETLAIFPSPNTNTGNSVLQSLLSHFHSKSCLKRGTLQTLKSFSFIKRLNEKTKTLHCFYQHSHTFSKGYNLIISFHHIQITHLKWLIKKKAKSTIVLIVLMYLLTVNWTFVAMKTKV